MGHSPLAAAILGGGRYVPDESSTRFIRLHPHLQLSAVPGVPAIASLNAYDRA